MRVSVVRLTRNFGQHVAMTAGLGHTRGKWIVVTDCDLQDPPEQIPALYDGALEGFDVVLARRFAAETRSSGVSPPAHEAGEVSFESFSTLRVKDAYRRAAAWR